MCGTRYFIIFPSPPPSQAGDAPLPMNTKNDLHEFHCIQAYLVSDIILWGSENGKFVV